MADLGFPGGRQPHRGVLQPINLLKFAENCMKIKEFGPRGGTSLAVSVGVNKSFKALDNKIRLSSQAVTFLVKYKISFKSYLKIEETSCFKCNFT